MTVEISNETTYSTEDLRKLWDKTVETLDSEHAPTELLVGYYGGKATYVDRTLRERVERPVFVQTQKTGYHHNAEDVIPRVGIVKQTRLPRSPLEQLAVAGQDVMTVPAEVVRQIVCAFKQLIERSYYLGYQSLEIDASEWSWVADAQLSYIDNKNKNKADIEDAKRRSAMNSTNRTLSNIKWQEQSIVHTQEKLDKLLEKQRTSLSVYLARCKRLGLTPEELDLGCIRATQ